jgi:hypothetical protein
MQSRIHRPLLPYAASQYDDDLCLKPPRLLWLAALYLSRAIVLGLAVGLGSVAGVNKDSLSLLRGIGDVYALLPALLAVPVLVALTRRVSSAPLMVRWIWARGRIFIALSALSDMVLSLIYIVGRWEMIDRTWLSMLLPAIDIGILAYVLGSRRVRDSFADFPPHRPKRAAATPPT